MNAIDRKLIDMLTVEISKTVLENIALIYGRPPTLQEHHIVAISTNCGLAAVTAMLVALDIAEAKHDGH